MMTPHDLRQHAHRLSLASPGASESLTALPTLSSLALGLYWPTQLCLYCREPIFKMGSSQTAYFVDTVVNQWIASATMPWRDVRLVSAVYTDTTSSDECR